MGDYDFSIPDAIDKATVASNHTALMFTPIELDAVKPGMTLRFYDPQLRETIVSTIRVEHFSPVDGALVADAIYANARLTSIFEDYRVSVLVQA